MTLNHRTIGTFDTAALSASREALFAGRYFLQLLIRQHLVKYFVFTSLGYAY